MSNVFRVCFGLVSLLGGSYALAAAPTYEGGSFRTTLGVGVESTPSSSGMHAVVGMVSKDYYASLGGSVSLHEDRADQISVVQLPIVSQITGYDLKLDVGMRMHLEHAADLYFDYGLTGRTKFAQKGYGPDAYGIGASVGLSKDLSKHSMLSFHIQPISFTFLKNKDKGYSIFHTGHVTFSYVF